MSILNYLLSESQQKMNQSPSEATIVIDVFRAFTTACYILEQEPTGYFLTATSDVVRKLQTKYPKATLIGKPEKHCQLIYDIPNSPTRCLTSHIKGKYILHRTEAGAKGVLHTLKNKRSLVLATSFVNAEATVRYLQYKQIKQITIIPMGHEAKTPSLEDELCAEYILALFTNRKFSLDQHIQALRLGPGRYFFSEDQKQYPAEDFKRCLQMKRFNFAIKALLENNYAILTRCDTPATVNKNCLPLQANRL